ncbi:hypothetical protein GCM10010377_48390 [Streptomyces viridiviolaceus]|nr:GMC family oxidoreductase N-terminal domain-containing protein [Streptomyces viridiviolaceus]GHB51666.1 hypothetical protein GCM10010377_48390 [Streptomyces viridiviolaceus]
MGAHWAGACPRPGEGARIGFIVDAELDAHLTRAEQLLRVDAHAFGQAPFADEVRGRLSALFDPGRPTGRRVAPMPLAVTTRLDGAHAGSGTDVVLGPAARDERVGITDRCLCLRVVLDGDTVTGVTVRDLVTGEESGITARAVVVAADALRTPQLLHASGIRPAALGRHLNDQPQIVHAVRLPDKVPSTLTRKVVCHSWSSRSARRREGPTTPALCTRMSTGPSLSTSEATASGSVTSLVGARSEFGGDDPHALGTQLRRGRGADPACSAGDQGEYAFGVARAAAPCSAPTSARWRAAIQPKVMAGPRLMPPAG